MKIKGYIFFIAIFFFSNAMCQDYVIYLRDLNDILFKASAKKKKDTIEVKKIYPSLLPIVGYGPANGFVIGCGASLSGLFGNVANTHISSALFNITFTSKKQININLRSNVYTEKDKWIYQGDWRFLYFTQPTYGLGIYNAEAKKFDLNINAIETIEIPSAQPMRFNYLRLYENIYKQIVKYFYAGVGFNLDFHSAIHDEKLDTSSANLVLTPHYIYSVKNGFNPEKYATSGITFNVMYDSRDNAINSYKGQFAQLTFRTNVTWLESSTASNTLFYDYRKYFQLKKSKKGNVLAFWTWGQFLLNGKMPYLALPSITWDMYNRSGRGYVQGRFRGENMVYAESEYRFSINASGLFGAVLFANATTANNIEKQQKIFNSIAPGYGFGLRLKMSKHTRTNIGMDVGFGRFSSGGIYFNLQEAF